MACCRVLCGVNYNMRFGVHAASKQATASCIAWVGGTAAFLHPRKDGRKRCRERERESKPCC